MSSQQQKDNTNKDAIELSAAEFGTELSDNYADASDEMIAGMNLLRLAADQRENVAVCIKQGNLFEYIEAAKFNTNAALQDSIKRAVVTEAEGDPHAPADILIKCRDRILVEYQAKSYSNPSKAADALSEPKYNTMEKLVTKGQGEEVRQTAEVRASSDDTKSEEYHHTATHTHESLSSGNVSSPGTTYDENIEAAENPEWYATKHEIAQVGEESGITGLHAAETSLIVGGTISLIKNALSVHAGNKSVGDAIVDTAKESGSVAIRSGGIGSISSGVRYMGTRIGVQSLQKANIAVAATKMAIDIGQAVYLYTKGDITAEQAFERMGKSGFSTLSSVYVGAALGAAFGPVGVLAGSFIGYQLSAHIYNSCLCIMKNAELAEKETERVVALCNQACEQMMRRKQQFDEFIRTNLEDRNRDIEKCLHAIDKGFSAKDPDSTVEALCKFASLFNRELMFKTFAEFDEFMMETNEPLVIK